MTPFPLAACWASQKYDLIPGVSALRNGRLLLKAVSDCLLSPGCALFSRQAAKSENSDCIRIGEAEYLQSAASVSQHGAAEHPAAILRRILERLPPYPTHSTLQNVRRWIEESGLCANIPASLVAVGGRTPAPANIADSDAILAYVTGLLQPNSSHPVDRHWARASLPDLLLLLSRLRIPSHPKLETVLILILRRGKLPMPDAQTWQKLEHVAASTDSDCGNDSGSGSGRRNVRNSRARPSSLLPQQPPPPLAPTAFRLTQAMAALPVLSHEAWQQLADRHILARPGLLLDYLSPDQMTLVAAAFARAGYHPVELFRCIADRLLPGVQQLQPGSLARALHAYAVLRHFDPHLITALCKEVHCRTIIGGGGGGGTDGSAASGGGRAGSSGAGSAGGGSSFLSFAGVALFGGNRGGRPDRAHRAPQFLIEDLARLAAAAVQLGAGEASVRGHVSGGGGGFDSGRYGAGLGEQLLAAVAEDAEEAAAARIKVVLEALRTQSPPPLPGARASEVTAQPGYVHNVLYDGATETRSVESVVVGAVDIRLADDAAGELQSGKLVERTFDQDGLKLPASCPGGSSFGGSIIITSSSNSRSAGGGSLPAEQLEPLLTLIEALTAGAVGAPDGAAARAAHAIAAHHLVPELTALEPYMSPHQLVAVLAALLPGPGATALRQHTHPYPGPPPPQRLSSFAINVSGGDGDSRVGKLGQGMASRGDQLAAVVEALCRRTDLRLFRSARKLLEAWHVLAAACAGGAPGTDDPRLTNHLMAPVFACVVRHVSMLGSANEAARFVVSCALLSVYDKVALDTIAVPLVAALGGARHPSQQRMGVGNRIGYSSGCLSMTRCRTNALAPSSLAQLAWAMGHLGYVNEELLVAVQNQAMVLSAPSPFTSQRYQAEEQCLEGRHPPPPHWQQEADSGVPGDLCRDSITVTGPAAAAPAAAELAAAPLLGPLELADVMWGLAVNQIRTNNGADIRELYLRAASQGVVHIDDPRWLRLVQVHLLLLLGWAGGLGEAAAGQLRSGWFNALGYAWERQAVAQRSHLAGRGGLPVDPDPATATFRRGVVTAVRDLLRAKIPPVGGSDDGHGGGVWRLQPGFVWGMLQPSADIRLTVPLLLRFLPAAGAPLAVRGDFVSGGAGNGSGGGSGEWVIALDIVRCADEALMTTAAAGPAADADAFELAVLKRGEAEKVSTTGESKELGDNAAATAAVSAMVASCRPWRSSSLSQPLQPSSSSSSSSSYPPQQQQRLGEAHLLGAARWRHLVLRRLGVVVRTVRQMEWEGAVDEKDRRAMLLRALRL